MYSKELEELIENVLADGVITEQERAVLRKRAQACGEDPDEVMVVVEGRLTKAKKAAKPANEKRGNVVHCPACGALVEAGSGKCAECGYVFTNVKTNSSAERFAKELAALISKHKGAKSNEEQEQRDREINEYIKNFPLPTSKEDMLEFISSMDARRRTQSAYQSAYGTKYKECATKAKVQFAGDEQIGALLSQTEKFSFSLIHISNGMIAVAGILLMLVLMGIIDLSIGGHDPHDVPDEAKVELIDKQYDEICSKIDALPAPTNENYDDCAMKVKRIAWKKISDSNRDNYETESYENDVMDKASDKVNGYIEMLHTIHMEYIDEKGNPTDDSDCKKDPKYIKTVNFQYPVLAY